LVRKEGLATRATSPEIAASIVSIFRATIPEEASAIATIILEIRTIKAAT